MGANFGFKIKNALSAVGAFAKQKKDKYRRSPNYNCRVEKSARSKLVAKFVHYKHYQYQYPHKKSCRAKFHYVFPLL